MSGSKGFDREMKRVEAEANKAAGSQVTAEAKAKAYVKVLKRHGITGDVREMTKLFKRLMGE